ncbi:hypothetical protein M0Q97_06135 [Candidatus Dojkabacteria bacterium]|jgi:hypothetical protein|nr:hypothetical protein [Candidatus Dojkabacteria bacterium]
MKIFKFNELMVNTYNSYIDKVKNYDDPRHKEYIKMASDLILKKYISDFITFKSVNDDTIPFRFYVFKIELPHPKMLGLSGRGVIPNTGEQIQNITLNIENNIIYYNNDVGNRLYADRKTANIMFNILKDYDININKRDIPQF